MFARIRSIHHFIWVGFGLGLAAVLPVALYAVPAEAAMSSPSFYTPLFLEQQIATYDAPNLAAPIEAVLPAGSTIDEINQQTGADGMLWLQLGQTDFTPLGWVRAVDLLPVVDFQNSVLPAPPQAVTVAPPFVTDVPQFVSPAPEVILAPLPGQIVSPFPFVGPVQRIVVREPNHGHDHNIGTMPIRRMPPFGGRMR